jgi:hypothetical protein
VTQVPHRHIVCESPKLPHSGTVRPALL